MLYITKGIKETVDKTYNIEILMDVSDQNIIRNLFEELHIIILSITPQPQRQPSEFGHIVGTIDFQKRSVPFAIAGDNIQDVANMLVNMGFTVTMINDPAQNITAAQGQQIIDNAKQYSQQLQQSVQISQKAQEQHKKKVFHDPALHAAKDDANTLLEDITQITQTVSGKVSGLQLKKLHEQTEELKKLIMGTNNEKIYETMGEILHTVNEIIDTYIQSTADNSNAIDNISALTYTDIIDQYRQWKTYQLAKNYGMTLSSQGKYYQFMGKIGMYRRFLKKDISQTKRTHTRMTNILPYSEIIVIMIIVMASVAFVFNTKILYIDDQSRYYFFLLSLGTFGILVYIAKFITGHRLFQYLLIVALVIGGYIFIRQSLITHFAL